MLALDNVDNEADAADQIVLIARGPESVYRRSASSRQLCNIILVELLGYPRPIPHTMWLWLGPAVGADEFVQLTALLAMPSLLK